MSGRNEIPTDEAPLGDSRIDETAVAFGGAIGARAGRKGAPVFGVRNVDDRCARFMRDISGFAYAVACPRSIDESDD